VYRKLVEGVVAAVVPLLKAIGPQINDVDNGYRGGVLDTVVAVLILPGVQEKAMYAKVKHVFREVNRDFIHTKLAEERIVEALLA
jgi:hypothetical protein